MLFKKDLYMFMKVTHFSILRCNSFLSNLPQLCGMFNSVSNGDP